MEYGAEQIHVPDDGRRSARLVLIGEAPGRREVTARRPFVGPSGRLLREWWAQVGLSREDFYVTNFCPYLPTKIDDLSIDEARHWTRKLHERLAQLDDPWLIVPTGNYALYALTGKGKVSWHTHDNGQKRPGITSHRGSIYSVEINGRPVKVIPTIHPAATFLRRGEKTPRSIAAQNTRACIADWRRIAADRHFRELAVPERDYFIKPTLADVHDFVREAAERAVVLSVDIETPPTQVTWVQLTDKKWMRKSLAEAQGLEIARYKSGAKKGRLKTKQKDDYAEINCIGFSFDPAWSLTIPVTRAYWRDEAVLREVWGAIATLLALPCQKIMQNGFYDAFWLRTECWPDGAPKVPCIENWIWDTRAMHHAYDPTDKHSLEYLVSVFTRTPYFKDECKDPESIAKFSHGEALWTYNGMDVCTTLEVWQRLRELLLRHDMLDLYQQSYAEMIEPLLETSLHGVAMDDQARQLRLTDLLARRDAIETAMDTAAGIALRGKKGAVSSQRLQKLLYTEWGLPKQYKKADKSGRRAVTTDDVTLKRLMRRYPKVEAVGKAVLEHREVRKMAEPLADGKCDGDGRIRCEFHFYTAAGRLASTSNARGTGRNLQNIQRGPTRGVFLPDAG